LLGRNGKGAERKNYTSVNAIGEKKSLSNKGVKKQQRVRGGQFGGKCSERISICGCPLEEKKERLGEEGKRRHERETKKMSKGTAAGL